MRAVRHRRREFLTRAIALAFVLVCAVPASAQLDQWGYWENGVSEHWWFSSTEFESADAVNVVSRWKSIGEANALDANAAWAGDYFRGSDTSGTYMRWSPQAGFVIAHINKCEARVTGLIYGRVEATPTLVQFFPEFYKVPSRKRGGEGEEQKAATTPAVLRYVPVEWRGEHLLVAEDEMGDFGDYLAGVGDYNGVSSFIYLEYTNFFSRLEARGEEADADIAKASNAPPVVPPGYERFLKKPVEATITAVGGRSVKRDYALELPNNSVQYERASLTRVTISAGTAQGVKDRMAFLVTEPEEGDTVIVLRAGVNESAAVVIRDVDEHGKEFYYDEESREMKHSKVAAGWRLTTSPF